VPWEHDVTVLGAALFQNCSGTVLEHAYAVSRMLHLCWWDGVLRTAWGPVFE
jgi:hypothetical protein